MFSDVFPRKKKVLYSKQYGKPVRQKDILNASAKIVGH